MNKEFLSTTEKLIRRMQLKHDIKYHSSVLESSINLGYDEYCIVYKKLQLLIEEKKELDSFVNNYDFKSDSTISNDIKKIMTIHKNFNRNE